jgi:hypothetical protein
MSLPAAQALGLIACAATAAAGYLWTLMRNIGSEPAARGPE